VPTDSVTKDIVLNGIVVGKFVSTGNDELDVEVMQEALKKKGLWKEIKAEEMMFNQAQSFANTAKTLYVDGIKNNQRNIHSFAPFVVNATFSIEIYLKTLHKLFGQNKRGHSLKALYKSLDNKGKEHISKIAVETKHMFHLEEGKDFEYYLYLLDKAFEEWRYIYEGKSDMIYFSPTIYVMQVLDKACVNVKNEKT